ncbi:MAG: hypothetical protein IT577_22795 [Verrucomicrobiae bacterium]|nr:hypothetical protein [Verrucomicrobiae bacterium]
MSEQRGPGLAPDAARRENVAERASVWPTALVTRAKRLARSATEFFKPTLSLVAASVIAAPCAAPAQSVPPGALTPPPGDRPVVVRASFHLWEINGIDDEAETFEFTGVLTLVWKDPRQAFDPAKEGVAEKIYQGSYQCDEISPSWYPQVVLANVSGTCDRDAILLRVRPDGTCTQIETFNAVAKSDLNLRRYPFDRQRLEAVFEVLGFGSGDVALEVAKDDREQPPPQLRVPQWDLRDVTSSTRKLEAPYAGTEGASSAFVLAIDVRRQSFFVVRLIMLPLVVIVMLSWSVFWMDRSAAGDRVSVSFVGILTVVAYQMVIGGILPDIAYVTFIHGFLNVSFLLMCATVAVNLWVGACEKRGESARGHRIDHRCRWAFPITYALLIAAVAGISTFCF